MNGIFHAAYGGGDNGHRWLACCSSEKFGRTIVADELIKKGTVFLVETVLLIPNEEVGDVISAYTYVWDKKHSAMVLGFGSLFNHSYSPNAEYEQDFNNMRMKYRAIRDIKMNEEIFINYNGDPEDKSPVWFKVK